MAGAKAPKTIKEEPLEIVLWKAADKLRKNIDAAEYKHVVLGLIFLKYISDSFVALFDKLQAGEGEFAGADAEDKDEYKAENVFFVPPAARWSHLLAMAKQPKIGVYVDEAMDAIEKENPSLKGVLPKVYARQNLDPASLGELIDLVGNIALGDAKARSADVLGHVFEYFLGEFALAEGKKGVLKLLSKILDFKKVNPDNDLFKGQNLLEFAERFKSDEDCNEYLAHMKWSEGYVCLKCGHKASQTRNGFSRVCNKCSHIESVTANTLFHKIRFGVRKAFFIGFEMAHQQQRAFRPAILQNALG